MLHSVVFLHSRKEAEADIHDLDDSQKIPR